MSRLTITPSTPGVGAGSVSEFSAVFDRMYSHYHFYSYQSAFAIGETTFNIDTNIEGLVGFKWIDDKVVELFFSDELFLSKFVVKV